MKKIFKFISFVVLLFFCFNANSQVTGQRRHKTFSDKEIGICLTGGGAAFILMGVGTGQYYNTNNQMMGNASYTTQTPVPFLQQGPKTVAICTGVTLTITGLFTIISSKN